MKTGRVLIAVLSTALTSLCLAATTAQAGTYHMRSCNVPGERAASVGPWTWRFTSAEIYANDECARGGGFGLNAGTISNGNVAALHLGIPGEGPQSSITIRRVRLWMIARLSGSGGNMFVNFSSGNPTQEMHQDLFAPPGGSTLTEPFVSPVLLSDTQLVFVGFACSGGTGGACWPENSNPLEIRGAEVTLHEGVSPSGVVQGGPLLERHPQSGVRALNYTAADAESGVAEVSARLGDRVVAVQDFRSECTYADLAACATARSGSMPIDTRAVKDGDYPLALRITDAAGNHETVTTAETIRVANGAGGGDLPTNGTSATHDARLTATFMGRTGSKATVPYYGKLTIRGRLTTSAGVPIGRAKVEIVETPVGIPRRARTRAVTTRVDGRFSYVVERGGTSRNLRIRYRPSLNDAGVAASRLLGVRVSAAGTLRVALRGVRVSYRGRVVSGPIPRGGKRVYLEGRAVGGRWTRFAIKRTNSAGRFSGRYRLRVHRPGVRLQFRLRIPRQTAYPYTVGVGNPVTRTVH